MQRTRSFSCERRGGPKAEGAAGPGLGVLRELLRHEADHAPDQFDLVI